MRVARGRPPGGSRGYGHDAATERKTLTPGIATVVILPVTVGEPAGNGRSDTADSLIVL
jgi:hypothetical protein